MNKKTMLVDVLMQSEVKAPENGNVEDTPCITLKAVEVDYNITCEPKYAEYVSMDVKLTVRRVNDLPPLLMRDELRKSIFSEVYGDIYKKFHMSLSLAKCLPDSTCRNEIISILESAIQSVKLE